MDNILETEIMIRSTWSNTTLCAIILLVLILVKSGNILKSRRFEDLNMPTRREFRSNKNNNSLSTLLKYSHTNGGAVSAKILETSQLLTTEEVYQKVK